MLDDMYPDDPREPEHKVQRELFERVYCGDHGAFEAVCARAEMGASVLVYLSGRLMDSAVEVLKHRLREFDCRDYLYAPENDKDLEDVWAEPKQFITLAREFATSQPAAGSSRERRRPLAIFRNLDVLADGHGSVHARADAQTAFISVVEGARRGIVVGLSDINEPELPGALTRAFSETVRIQGIPWDRFETIIPRRLGERLVADDRLDDGAIWQLHARLRWTDPRQAFRVMQEAAGRTDFESILEHVTRSTRSVSFVNPNDLDAEEPARKAGSHLWKRIELLELTLIKPFEEWKRFRGTAAQCAALLKRLPSGTVLSGPPGTGKTHLARWIARRIGLPVRIISGAEIRAPAWGEAERKVRQFFDEIRRAAPCVVILDEADDLLTTRDEHAGGLASAERAVVDEFLQQLDGVRGRLDGVLVIATTNRDDHLDAAAKARLSPVHRIPYPQERSEVEALVDHFATVYDYDVRDVRLELEDFFFGIVPGRSSQDRFTANRGEYFSPRDIGKAMRMLNDWSGKPTETYRVKSADVHRIKEHFSQG